MAIGGRRVLSLGTLAIVASMALAAADLLKTGATAKPRNPESIRETLDPALAEPMAASLLMALHNANVTGNYSVLRDMAAPQLINRMTATDLADHFRKIRQGGSDLSGIVGLHPRFSIPPTVVRRKLLWIEGVYPVRPEAIRFRILLQRVGEKWRFLNIDVFTGAPPHEDPGSGEIAQWLRLQGASDYPDGDMDRAAGSGLRGSVNPR